MPGLLPTERSPRPSALARSAKPPIPRGSFQKVSWSKRSKRSGGSTVCAASCRTGPETGAAPARRAGASNSGSSYSTSLEVVVEPLLAEEAVDQPQAGLGLLGEDVVVDQQQVVGVLAVVGLLERRIGEADHPVAVRQRLGAAVDGRALVGGAEQPRRLEGVAPHQPLEAVHDPGDVAHAAEHPAPRGRARGSAAAARTTSGWCRRPPSLSAWSA